MERITVLWRTNMILNDKKKLLEKAKDLSVLYSWTSRNCPLNTMLILMHESSVKMGEDINNYSWTSRNCPLNTMLILMHESSVKMGEDINNDIVIKETGIQND
ncbi:hypothetical protein QE152_g6624 [Popillia japonica]|uniref:Uncharacterized protein n=1 Tax=Popillia japonica TaxID=7064 RepID=A0AAW1MJQ1_POPJA